MTGKIKNANYKSFLASQLLEGLFLNFREIEPSVSYKKYVCCKRSIKPPGRGAISFR